MSKGFWGSFSAVSFAVCLSAVLFTGCPSPSSNSTTVANAPVDNQQTPEKKNEQEVVSNSGASQNREVLWDFRKLDAGKPETFPKTETDAVLKYLLGEKWDPALEITSRVSGAFTKPNAKETLYFVTGCKDQSGNFVSNEACGHAGWNTAGWIAVFDGTTPILKIEESLGGAIEKVSDVNSDGINEILAIGGYAGMGIITETAVFGQVSGGKFEEIKTFRGSADNCAEGLSNDKKGVAATIFYTPSGGKMPEFSEENFMSVCIGESLPDNPQWSRISKQQFDEFFDGVS